MSEKSLSELLSIDESAEEALARAGVRTLRELSEAEPEALAMASGVPLDRIKEWQQRARRAGAPKRRNPVVTGWKVAIVGLLIAGLVGWISLSIAGRKMERAVQMQREAESKLEVEVKFGARKALEELRPARLALHNDNWGEAADELGAVRDYIELMQRVAAKGSQSEVEKVSKEFEQLEAAIEEQSKNAMDDMTALEGALDELMRSE